MRVALDPFAEIRCRECGWVHYRELPCPSPPAVGWLFEAFVYEWLSHLIRLGAPIFGVSVEAAMERSGL